MYQTALQLWILHEGLSNFDWLLNCFLELSFYLVNPLKFCLLLFGRLNLIGGLLESKCSFCHLYKLQVLKILNLLELYLILIYNVPFRFNQIIFLENHTSEWKYLFSYFQCEFRIFILLFLFSKHNAEIK